MINDTITLNTKCNETISTILIKASVALESKTDEYVKRMKLEMDEKENW
jgi:hypothetical protein